MSVLQRVQACPTRPQMPQNWHLRFALAAAALKPELSRKLWLNAVG